MKAQITAAYEVKGGCFFTYPGYADFLKSAGQTSEELRAELKADNPNLVAKNWLGQWKSVNADGSLAE